jgi:hypothetical protein
MASFGSASDKLAVERVAASGMPFAPLSADSSGAARAQIDCLAPRGGRGLKLIALHVPVVELRSPPTGAWIETSTQQISTPSFNVPFHTGAWIETLMRAASMSRSVVAPPPGGVD